MYLSFESDPAPERVLDASPPPTLERLRAVKGAWDPEPILGLEVRLKVLLRSGRGRTPLRTTKTPRPKSINGRQAGGEQADDCPGRGAIYDRRRINRP